MQIDEIRSDIILKSGILYFDFTASGLGLKSVEKEMEFVLRTYANTHSECSKCAKITSDYYENSRAGIKRLLGLGDDFYLVPCGCGSTTAIKRFQEILGIYIPPKTREVLEQNFRLNFKDKSKFPLILISPYEHHSNEISYREGLCEVRRIPLKNGIIDYCALENTLKKSSTKARELWLCFSAASNVTGVKTDCKKLRDLGLKFGTKIALDVSSIVAYENIPSEYFDALFISSHKLLGGVGGSGLLAIRREICAGAKPTFAGGGVVEYVNKKRQIYVGNFERAQDAGTPGIMQLIRAFLAFKFRNQFGLENIARIEAEHLAYFENALKSVPNLVCYCPSGVARLPIFAFNIRGISPFDLARILSDEFGIQVRAGCSCAGPYGHDLLRLKSVKSTQDFAQKPGWVRVSLHYTHTKDEIDFLINALKIIARRVEKFGF